jgi:hypothetical protein
MGRFAMVECATWDDPQFQSLGTDARLLFLWSWTNPRAAICGLYHASERMLRRAISDQPLAEVERTWAALEELAAKPLLKYDAEAEVVFVVNRAKYANRSPKVAQRMQTEVEACPSSPLVGEFVNRYGEMLKLRLED